MSALNGDRARFQKNRKRKLQRRQRIRALAARLRKRTDRMADRESESRDPRVR